MSYPVSVLLEKIPKIIIDITMTKIKTSISTITLANRDTATISLPAVRSVIVLKYVKSKLMAKALLRILDDTRTASIIETLKKEKE